MKGTTFMQMAYIAATESKCVSLSVGAVIVKDDRIIGMGVNGTPSGQPNCCDVAKEKGWMYHDSDKKTDILDPTKRPEHSKWSDHNEIHAELNAILFAAKNGIAIRGATMYVTHSPCHHCCKAITQSGISQVVFCELYDRAEHDWDLILKHAGVKVHQINKHHLTQVKFK